MVLAFHRALARLAAFPRLFLKLWHTHYNYFTCLNFDKYIRVYIFMTIQNLKRHFYLMLLQYSRLQYCSTTFLKYVFVVKISKAWNEFSCSPLYFSTMSMSFLRSGLDACIQCFK